MSASSMSAQGAVAALFPGQGVRVTRAEVGRRRPDLLRTLDRLFDGDAFAEAGRSTASAQPAIYCASLAAWSGSGREDARFFAGHSLGEITALVAAGWLTEAEGLHLVVRRGLLMQQACDRTSGGMIAIFDIAPDVALELAESLDLVLAADNCPGQVVLSGESVKLEALSREARVRRLNFVTLPVAGAFHSPLMRSAIEPLRAALAEVDWAPKETLVLSADTLSPIRAPVDELSAALIRPVRWREVLLSLQQRGVHSFVGIGPGKSLLPMTRRTLPDADVS
jgi:[acyl-carrier-protein] S-malonyltransferase